MRHAALAAAAVGGDGRFEARKSANGFKRNGERCKSPLIRWEAAPR